MKQKRTAKQAGLPFAPVSEDGPLPAFRELLSRPRIDLPLPSDFDAGLEAKHLETLWEAIPKLRRYHFEQFIHAGGSGMVFRVKEKGGETDWALKIARKKTFDPAPKSGIQESPFSEAEITALQQVSHPNVVTLRDRITAEQGVVGLVTTYVPDPQPLDEYLRKTFARDPDPNRRRGIASFSPERLDGACAFLVARFSEMASALEHMHGRSLFHCDVKPANILIGAAPWRAILTDLGSCVSLRHDRRNDEAQLRIHFTWTYAHPNLRNLEKDVREISGGGLRVSANVDAEKLQSYDLFALGRTIQETLAILVAEFGERCFAAYGFRFLHLVACMLLDGQNAPLKDRVMTSDGRRFVSDAALDYPTDLFERHKITSADDLVERLRRFDRDYSWYGRIPELDPWQPEYVNTGSGPATPYTRRVLEVFNHPAVRRLRAELQLGWVRDVYPGATHTRWSHTLGVFANVCAYYSALLADPELPTARLLLDQADIEHGLVAALVHDIGQTAFGHDFEVINSSTFSHERLIPKLLYDKSLGSEALATTIGQYWKNIDLNRVLLILGVKQEEKVRKSAATALDVLPSDGLARDMINGPIDADKLDYLIRDAASCGVPYGAGIDRGRFLRSLTVHVRKVPGSRACRLALAYRAKGAAAVESLLLARYQMYGAVYWHHTYRCIQAMLVQAVSTTFVVESGLRVELIQRVFYDRVVKRLPVDFAKLLGSIFKDKRSFSAPPEVAAEPSLEFAWQFADAKSRRLLERVARRDLYKRVYEIRTAELGHQVDYSSLQDKLAPNQRPNIAEALEGFFLRAIHTKIAQKHGPVESTSESQARSLAQQLKESELPLVVVDYPVRGIPDEKNIPLEIGDPSRKYISGASVAEKTSRDVFVNVRRLQIDSASVRVFAEPHLHQLIVRYLDPSEVHSCVLEAMPFLATHH
jgi:HD superfamily phosphohydrolase/serine/threonine protein kinase